MTTKEKIIRRLNKGFGFDIPINAPCFHHLATFYNADGRFSWVISNGSIDVGSTSSMKECLSWKRWVYNKKLNEIFEYYPNARYCSDDIIEMEGGKNE